ncbi:hypothetical protein [Rhodococcus opacus]|uniref:hypothetical protein n=1 Tax=Rhodococcus opacus TaxID=37919 RepID=UPI0024BB6EA9|nr:hypothetical protein [Rhodococcus opacus]MDJ0420073.1 hypothetical protein [Rhodococcus opacus]
MTAGVVMSVGIIGAIFVASTQAGSMASKEAPKSGEVTSYTLNRYTLDTRQDYTKFVARFEKAVPSFTPDIVASASDWNEVVANTAGIATNGFLIYTKFTDWPWGRFSGMEGLDKRRGTMYLMGNHVIAETMYRHNPGVMAHAPLRLMIFENERGDAVFQIERPSDQFAAYGDEEIAKVGLLLNQKLESLLRGLDVPVPSGLPR